MPAGRLLTATLETQSDMAYSPYPCQECSQARGQSRVLLQCLFSAAGIHAHCPTAPWREGRRGHTAAAVALCLERAYEAW